MWIMKIPELNKTLAELSRKVWDFQNGALRGVIQRHPARIQTIVGTTNLKRLQDICTAGNVRLSREDWYKIYLSAGNELPVTGHGITQKSRQKTKLFLFSAGKFFVRPCLWVFAIRAAR